MENLILFFYILISVVLIILIMLQQGKGSDIGSAFGSGSSNTMLGSSSSSNPLAKVTAVLAVLFLVLSLGMTWNIRTSDKSFVPGVLENKSQIEDLEGALPNKLTEQKNP